MKKNKIFFWFFIFIFVFIFNDKVVYAREKSKNILILNSYHRGFLWSDEIEGGILSEINELDKEFVDVKIEYMDSKENSDKLYYEKLVELYKYKYSNKKFDLIICSDNAAIEFLIQYKEKIFPNVPIVFCGVNDFDSYKSKDLGNITGVKEDIDIYSNIKLILGLHPDTKNIVAVIDNSYIGNLVYNGLTDLKKKNKFNIEIRVINEKFIKNTIKEINKLPNNSVVLFASAYTEDSKGDKIYNPESIKYISKNTKVPIYGMWDQEIGYGTIGGKVICGFEQGKQAGKMALNILEGKSVKDIPVESLQGIKYIFDYNQLMRFSINENQLPEDRIIINEPQSVYSIAKGKLQKAAAAIIMVFLLTIILLIINILKRKKLEDKLTESKKELEKNFNFLRTLIDTIPNPIFCKNSEGKYTDCNIHYENFVGLKKENIINHTVFEIIKQEFPNIYHLSDVNLLKSGGTQAYESKVKFADETTKDVLFSKACIVGANGEKEGLVGVILDITERKKIEDKIKRISNLKEAILEINQSIIGIDNINELFDLILEKAINSIEGAKYGSILLLTGDNKLIITAQRGYDKEKSKKFCIPLEGSFAWRYTKGSIKKTIIINDVEQLEDIKIAQVYDEKDEWSIKSSITSPINIDNKLYGMLNIDSDKKNAFTEIDLETMEYMRTKIEICLRKHKLYEEISYLSRYDKLTDIYNRRYFEDILYNQLNDVKEFKIVVFDLNGLKFVNDNYSHLAGDEYIKTFVNELKKASTPLEIIARYGGDEFIGIFYDEVDVLNNKFKKILKDLESNPLEFEGKQVCCSFSYGIASYPEDSTIYNKLIKIADDRMYKCKEKMKERRK